MRFPAIVLPILCCALVAVSCDDQASANDHEQRPAEKSEPVKSERGTEPRDEKQADEKQVDEKQADEKPNTKAEPTTSETENSSPDTETEQKRTRVSLQDMRIGPDGLDVLSKWDDGDISSVRKKLGGLKVIESERHYEGSEMPVYLVEKQEKTLFKIHPSHGKVGSIWVLSPEIEGPNQTRVGLTYAEIVERVGALHCIRARGSLAGKVMCNSKEIGNHLQYAFDAAQVDDDIDEPTAKHMKGLKVQSIRSW